MATLSLDFGTSAVKALILSDAGRVSAVASEAYPIDRPHPGWAEADPSAWLRAAGSTCGQVGATMERRRRAGPAMTAAHPSTGPGI